MAEGRGKEVQVPEEDPSARSAAASAKVNWVPTVVMLALFVWWVLFAFAFYGRFPDLRDTARFVAYLLLAGVFVAGVPAIVRQVRPEATPTARRSAALLIYVVVAIPLAFALFWSGYDALTPVDARGAGDLPDVGALIGRNQHDVARMLGEYDKVSEAALPPGDNSDPFRPGGADAVRFVVYSLPDLNTLDDRPEKRASVDTESKELENEYGTKVTPDQWGSDAVVIVYYGETSKAVGARMDVSLRSAAAALSSITSQTVLPAVGVTPQLAIDAAAGRSRASGLTTAPITEIVWGNGSVDKTQVGYELRIGGLATFAAPSEPSSQALSADRGDLTVVVAPGLTDSNATVLADASAAVPSGIQSDALQKAASADQPPHGTDSHSDETFWVIICSPYYSTETQALQRAGQLNAQGGKSAGHFAVERTGHLAGLTNTDAWLVVYDVGYGWQDQAEKAVVANSLGHALPDARVVQITKECGDLTISQVVR